MHTLDDLLTVKFILVVVIWPCLFVIYCMVTCYNVTCTCKDAWIVLKLILCINPDCTCNLFTSDGLCVITVCENKFLIQEYFAGLAILTSSYSLWSDIVQLHLFSVHLPVIFMFPIE